MEEIRGKIRAAWLTLLLLLVLAALVHPLGSTIGWTSGKQSLFGHERGTLDGMAYVEALDHGDYEAIKWINENTFLF